MTREDLLRRLRSYEVGFYAVANDFEAGRIGEADISDYLRRDATGVSQKSQGARIDLAKDIDRRRRADVYAADLAREFGIPWRADR